MWAECGTVRLHKFIPTPSHSGQGVGLSRRAGTKLNRLRNWVGRFGASMHGCDCEAKQTADRITSGRCSIYRSPEGINDFVDLDDKSRALLENNGLVMSDDTRRRSI